MAYFRVLSVFLGALMTLGGLGISLFPRQAKQWAEKLYPEMCPRWLMMASTVALALLAWTWYRLFNSVSIYAFSVTLVLSLTASKIALSALFYKKFHKITMALLEELLALRVVMMSMASVGFALLILGLFF